MIRNRRNRFATVLFALVSLLFMQFAVAAYSCPGGLATAGLSAEMTLMAQAATPCAESMARVMDDDQPSLCHAHCHADQQSADKYQLPGLATVADVGCGIPPPRVAPVLMGLALQAPLLSRTTAPPLTVRNCCFRI